MTKYTNVRGLARGLQVLRALNAMESGRATSQQISDATGLHRTTVRRLLETLMEEGFVRRSGSDDSFRLTLDGAFTERRLHGRRTNRDHRAADHGSAAAARRVAIGPDDARRRRDDHPRDDASVQSVVVSSFDGRPPPADSADGGGPRLLRDVPRRASERTFSNCCARARAAKSRRRSRSNDALVRNLVRRVRADGFGSNHGDWTAQSKIGAVAVADRVERARAGESERGVSVARGNARGSEASLRARTSNGLRTRW